MQTITKQFDADESFDEKTISEDVREILQRTGVFTIVISGTPGSGKTSLIEAMISRMSNAVRIGVIVCRNDAAKDCDRLKRWCNQVQTVNAPRLTATQVRRAIAKLDLSKLDLLFIEEVADSGDLPPAKLGQNARIAVFSVTGGDDKAGEYPNRVGASDAVVLTKTDLLTHVPFNSEAFRRDVVRICPKAALFELSIFEGPSLEPWLKWIKRQLEKSHKQNIATDLDIRHPESFIG